MSLKKSQNATDGNSVAFFLALFFATRWVPAQSNRKQQNLWVAARKKTQVDKPLVEDVGLAGNIKPTNRRGNPLVNRTHL